MAHESIVNLTEETFDDTVKGSDVPVIVDFWAEWCGPCRMLGPILDEIAAEKGDAVKIAKVDVDSNQALAGRFNIRSIPLILFFKGGEQKDQVVGVQSKQAILAKLDALS